MFWSKPKLLISPDSQKWIEAGFQWLLEQFGRDYFLSRRTILPTAAYFPDPYRGTEDCVLRVVHRTCGYMDVAPDSVEVSFFEEAGVKDRSVRPIQESRSGAAGLYFHTDNSTAKAQIAIHSKQLQKPMALVATIAHELGHVILLGGGRLSREYKSHEYITDLLTVFLGMGIFTANAAFQFNQWQDNSHQGWSASRQGYLSEELFGYALAVYCRMRGETRPEWTDMLAMNVRHYFKGTLAYFAKGGQTSLTPLTQSKQSAAEG